jgi:hypothetical protein
VLVQLTDSLSESLDEGLSRRHRLQRPESGCRERGHAAFLACDCRHRLVFVSFLGFEIIATVAGEVEDVPVDTAVDEGRATVAVPLEFSEPVVSRVMDEIQRYIVDDDDRPADEVVRADATLAAPAAQHLSTGTATEVYIYTMDIAAGEGAGTVLVSEGYGDSVTFVNGFRSIEGLVAGDS